MTEFINCNSNLRTDGMFDFEVSDELALKQLNDSVKSGLIPD